MATLFEINYSGQAVGTVITAANAGLDLVAGSPQFSNEMPTLGAGILSATGTAQHTLRKNVAARTSLRSRWFMKVPVAAPAVNVIHADVRSGSTQVAAVRIDTTGALRLVNGNTAVGTASAPLVPNEEVRLEWILDGTALTQTLHIFRGANKQGSTPDQTLTGAFSGTAFDNTLCAQSVNTPYTVHTAAWKATDSLATMIGGTVAVPSVSAGPDITVEVGGSAFTITGTAAGSGGATIASRAWERTSGAAVTLQNATTNTVTVTPPSAPGQTVLRFSATDSTGQSSNDSMTITWVAAGQSLRPVSDVANPGGWTAVPTGGTLASKIDETVADDTDYIASPDGATADVYEVALSPGQAPGAAAGQLVQFRAWRDAGVSSHTLLVELREGSNVRASATFTDLTTVPTTRQFALSEAESNSVGDWANVRLRFTVTTA